MHAALFIDEVLQYIFQFSQEDGLAALVSAAQCCKAWKDPALDHIWSRLSSVIPLLQLIPSLELNNGIYILRQPTNVGEIRLLHKYARRVKHISHKEHVRVDSDVLSLLCDNSSFPSTVGVLQHLRSVQLSASNYTALQRTFALSPQLERLDCHLGFSSQNAFTVDDICDYLDHATTISSRLQTICIRGHGLPRLNTTISSLTHLSTVSLRMGPSLLPATLKAIIEFPSLLELELHVGHIELNELFNIGSSITFPVLRKLSVRGHTPVIAFLLERLQPGTICTARLEFEDDSLTSKSWGTITDLLTNKGDNSLRLLTMEHHIEVLDGDDGDNHSDVVTDSTLISDDTPLSSLRKLCGLRQLVLDMSTSPRIHDKDVASMASWWPHLEQLDLGSVTMEASCKAPLATVTCLTAFAQFWPKLKQLSLPLSTENIPQPASTMKSGCHSALERLYIGYHSPHDARKLAEFLSYIFPSLNDIDGADGKWEKTQIELGVLRAIRSEYELFL
ncbi:hypothetical protein BDQ17DRAFT_1239325 [Cyathus striatus]|nr:hypothetical protein BDQ17DRAFT_1239325 [Cyathus striatus]